jgi:hypothetical protein
VVTAVDQLGSVAQGDERDGEPLAYRGEVWTDGRGYATVALPRSAARLQGTLEYELRPFERDVTAAIAAELVDGRFTIATDEPHVKVAWAVRVLRPLDMQRRNP